MVRLTGMVLAAYVDALEKNCLVSASQVSARLIDINMTADSVVWAILKATH